MSPFKEIQKSKKKMSALRAAMVAEGASKVEKGKNGSDEKKQTDAKVSAREPMQSKAPSRSKKKGSKSLPAGTEENKNPETRPTEELVDKSVSTTIKDKMMMRQNRFPWLSYEKCDMGEDYAWCKICDMSVYLPNSKCGMKHQHTMQHNRLRSERTRNVAQPQRPSAANTEGISAAVTAAAALGISEPIQKAAMAELQSKYKWLQPDANDENHCHCRVCDTRLVMKAFFLRQHDSSRNHIAGLKRQKRNTAKEPVPLVSNNSEDTADLDNDSESDMSVISDDNTAERPAKRSRLSIDVNPDPCVVADKRDTNGTHSIEQFPTMDREGAKGHDNCMAHAQEPVKAAPKDAQPSEPRHAMDLFFASIAQTMKSLPPGLAAMGKSKIMNVVTGLELKMLNMASAASADSIPSRPSPAAAASELITNNKDDQVMQNNNNDVNNKSTSGTPSASLPNGNGNPEDLPNNLRRSSSQLQVTNCNDSDSVRCVPLDQLMFQSPVNADGNGRQSHDGSLEAPWQYPCYAPANTREQQQELNNDQYFTNMPSLM